MLLSLWLSPSGKSGDLEAFRPCPLLSVKDIHPAVFTAQRLVAVRTRPTGPNPTAEALALRTALLAQQPGATARALVDDAGPGDRRRQRRERHRLPVAPGGLPTGVRAEPPTPARGERAPTAGAGYRHAIVTVRGISHDAPPVLTARFVGLVPATRRWLHAVLGRSQRGATASARSGRRPPPGTPRRDG